MKILILPLPEISHMNSFRHFLKRLGTYEHDCTIYVRQGHESIVEECGYTIRYYSSYFLENIFSLNENLKNGPVSVQPDKSSLTADNIQTACNAYMAAYIFRLRCMKKFLKSEEDLSCYDLIIHDYYLDFGGFLSRWYKIPSVTLISTLLPIEGNSEEYLENFINMKYFSNVYDAFLCQDKMRDLLMTSLNNMSKKIMHFTGQSFDFFKDGISKLNIYSTSKEFYPFEFNESEVDFVGREFTDEEVPNKVKSKNKRILFYFGAIETNEQESLFRCILRNLFLLPYEIHLAIKYERDKAYIEKDIKRGIILEEGIRLEDILSEMDLYICHGGLGGIQESIIKGVPIIGIGTSGERYENSKRIEQLGMGKSIQPSCEYINSKFKCIVEEIMNKDIYQKNCEKYRETLKISDKYLDEIIERLLHMAE